MAAVDGHIRIDTRVDTKGITDSLNKIGTSTKGAFAKVMAGLSKTLFSIGVAVVAVAAAVVGAIVLIAGAITGAWSFLKNLSKNMEHLSSETSFMHKEFKELNQKFADLKNTMASLFSPLLIAAMPIMEKIIAWFTRIVTLAQMAMAALLGQKSIMQYIAGSAEEAAKAAKDQLAAFDDINVLQQNKDPNAGYGQWIEVPIEDEVLEKIEKIKEWFRQAWENIKEWASAAWEWIVKAAVATWEVIVKVATWAWEHILGPVWEWLKTAALDAWAFLGKIWQWLKDAAISTWTWLVANVFKPIGEKLAWLWQVMKECGLLIYKNFILPVVGWFRDVFWPSLKKIWDGIAPYLSKIWQFVGDMFKVAWQWIKDGVASAWQFIVGIFKSALQILTGIINGVITAIGGIIQFIAGVFTAKWKLAWEGIKNIYIGIWEAIKATFKGVVNILIVIVNYLISSVVNGINAVIRALNKIDITIPDWVPLLGGKTWKFNLKEVEAPQVPLLARGAVIPPNAQFLAMLGDQRNGRNIEAPEELIRQIVREETASLGSREVTINFSGSLGALVRELKPYIDKENARVGRSLLKGVSA